MNHYYINHMIYHCLVQPGEQRGERVTVTDVPPPVGGPDQQDQQDHLPQSHGQAAHGTGD